MRNAIDPIRLEVLKNALESIADEMALIILRSAFSGIVRDAMDYSTAICDAQGRTLAQGLTTPLHLGSFHDAMRNLVATWGERAAPGDVFIFNDPYLAAGQHLPDVYIVAPVFVGERICGWATTLAHQNDVGGIVPGSNAIGSTEIFQEGLRLPILKLKDRGRPNETLWEIIRANVRVPDKVAGDLQAQISACEVAKRSFSDLVCRYGEDKTADYFDQLQDYAERLTRAEFAEMPDGVYRFSNFIDGLGEDPEPIPFSVKLTIVGDGVEVDWTGCSPEVPAGINAPFCFTKAATYVALRSVLQSDVPNSEGFTRAIRVVAPEGTIVNPRFPAPCGARGITGMRMIDCLMGALAQVVPDRVPADNHGGPTLISIASYDHGRSFIFVETFMGNSGSAPTHDGQEAVTHVCGNQSNIPVEMLERDQPLLVEEYGFLPDTGGAGRYRGGLSLARSFRILSDTALLNVRSDKRRFPPYGLEGGKAGAPSWNFLDRDGHRRTLPVLLTAPVALRKGDVYTAVLAGGGGYGDPFEREPELVLKDVVAGKVSVAAAKRDYGVVIRGRAAPRIDAAATKAMRAAKVPRSLALAK